MRIDWKYGLSTDPGLCKPVNEDRCFLRLGEKRRPGRAVLAVVADGMGGHGAGDKASQLAVDRLKAWWDASMPAIVKLRERIGILEREMETVFRQINDELWMPGAAMPAGSGTTLSVLIVIDAEYYVFHTGDSRVYLLGNDQEGGIGRSVPASSCLQSTGHIQSVAPWLYNSLLQLSTDQTWVAEEVDRGRLEREALQMHPRRNVLTHCLGINENVQMVRTNGMLHADEMFVLCSDGFFSLFSEAEMLYEINAQLEQSESLQAASDALVHAACLRGAPDNVSLMLLRPENSSTLIRMFARKLWKGTRDS